MNLKLGTASILFVGVLTGCAFRSQVPTSHVAFAAPEPAVFEAPFAPSPQYAATLEGGPHYTEGPELKRWMPSEKAENAGARGRGLPAPVNAKQGQDDAAEGEAVAIAGQGAPSAPPAAAPPARRPTVARQSTTPGGSWGAPSTGHPGDPSSASSF